MILIRGDTTQQTSVTNISIKLFVSCLFLKYFIFICFNYVVEINLHLIKSIYVNKIFYLYFLLLILFPFISFACACTFRWTLIKLTSEINSKTFTEN